jgi:hypothetical protein
LGSAWLTSFSLKLQGQEKMQVELLVQAHPKIQAELVVMAHPVTQVEFGVQAQLAAGPQGLAWQVAPSAEGTQSRQSANGRQDARW